MYFIISLSIYIYVYVFIYLSYFVLAVRRCLNLTRGESIHPIRASYHLSIHLTHVLSLVPVLREAPLEASPNIHRGDAICTLSMPEGPNIP